MGLVIFTSSLLFVLHEHISEVDVRQHLQRLCADICNVVLSVNAFQVNHPLVHKVSNRVVYEINVIGSLGDNSSHVMYIAPCLSIWIVIGVISCIHSLKT